MQDTKKTAFPITPGVNTNFGLTVREYFIAAAMQGLLSNANNVGLTNEQIGQKAIAAAEEVLRQV